MRRNLLTMALGFASLLAGCSGPSRSAPAEQRRILLTQPTTSSGAVASALEAPRPAVPRAQSSKARPTRDTLAALLTQLPALHLAQPVPALQALAVEPMPAIAESPAATPAMGGDGMYAGMHQGTSGGRASGGQGGPVIIIRGGLGGPDDKCDLRPRMWRGGIAINRSVPGFSGGYGRGGPPGGGIH